MALLVLSRVHLLSDCTRTACSTNMSKQCPYPPLPSEQPNLAFIPRQCSEAFLFAVPFLLAGGKVRSLVPVINIPHDVPAAGCYTDTCYHCCITSASRYRLLCCSRRSLTFLRVYVTVYRCRPDIPCLLTAAVLAYLIRLQISA